MRKSAQFATVVALLFALASPVLATAMSCFCPSDLQPTPERSSKKHCGASSDSELLLRASDHCGAEACCSFEAALRTRVENDAVPTTVQAGIFLPPASKTFEQPTFAHTEAPPLLVVFDLPIGLTQADLCVFLI